jgi:hypothetical protein
MSLLVNRLPALERSHRIRFHFGDCKKDYLSMFTDAFLPGLPGWEPIYNDPGIWHFRFNGEYPEALGERTGAHLLRILLERPRRG